MVSTQGAPYVWWTWVQTQDILRDKAIWCHLVERQRALLKILAKKLRLLEVFSVGAKLVGMEATVTIWKVCLHGFKVTIDKDFIFSKNLKNKGGSVEDRLYEKPYSTANLNFLFLSLFVCLLKNCYSQFFGNWKSAEPVFCSEVLSCLPYKNQNKSLTLSLGRKNSNLLYCEV